MNRTLTLFRVRGIPIGAHWTWLFVAALVIWSLATTLFPRTYPGLEPSTYYVMGAVAGLLLFTSILLHELGHALWALREGMRIEGITLWLFGGVAQFVGMFRSAGSEFRIAAAGPAVSIVLAALFAALNALGLQLDWPASVQGVVDYLWRINALVVGFNLVPALPLDGGRILRAWLWRRGGDFPAATILAARAGKAFGGLLIAIGVLDFFTGAAGAGGLWLVFLGWFLIQAADGEVASMRIGRVLGGRPVRDFMTPDPVTIDADVTVDRFLDAARTRRFASYPVVRDGEVLGLATLRRAAEVAPPERAGERVVDVMLARSDVPVLDPDTDMMEALDALRSEPRRALVFDRDRLLGILSVTDVMAAVERDRLIGVTPAPSTRRSGIIVWIVVAALMAAVAGLIYHPPAVVVQPGPTSSVAGDISISGVATDPLNGAYLLTSVELEHANTLELLWAALSSREVMSLSEVIPRGVDPDEYFETQREVFDQSRELAAAAAAQVAGLEVNVSGNGAVVQDVLSSSPARDDLRAGDVVVAVDGVPVELSSDLQAAIRARPPGTLFRLTIENGGATRTETVRSGSIPSLVQDAAALGVVISTRDFDIDLPFEVSFEERNVGGPSAGLAYSLAILDLLDPADLAEGRRIAATGTIDVGGRVGPIGGVDAKADSVKAAGADVFLVPETQLELVTIDGLDVRGVGDLGDARAVIERMQSAGA